VGGNDSDDCIGEDDDQLGLLPGLPPDLELLKAQWEAVMRDAITHQVVSDLRSDKTVEYIRSLESQLTRSVSETRRNEIPKTPACIEGTLARE
jgi:hypothetical protein